MTSKEKLGVDACLMQYPMGGGETFEGMIDLVTLKALYFDGKDGEKVREEAIPAKYEAEVKKYRHIMLETLAMYSDELMEILLAGARADGRAGPQGHQARRAAAGVHARVRRLGV